MFYGLKDFTNALKTTFKVDLFLSSNFLYVHVNVVFLLQTLEDAANYGLTFVRFLKTWSTLILSSFQNLQKRLKV